LLVIKNKSYVDDLLAKWQITVVYSNCAGLICLAIEPPSIIAAIGQRPSTLAVELFYSETRACP